MADLEQEIDPSDIGEAVEEVAIEYEKTPDYQTIRVDGVHGGINTKGEISIYLYSESPPLPDRTTIPVNDEGEIGESQHSSSDDVKAIREVEAGLSVDPTTAVSIVDWLTEKLVTAVKLGLIDEEVFEETDLEINLSDE